LNNSALNITYLQEDEINKYLNMYREALNGEYHGKQSYINDIEEINTDKESNVDENELAFRNLPKEEQEIIQIIKRTKEKTEKKIEDIKSQYKNKKKDALCIIAKEIRKKETDFILVSTYYDRDELENLINYIKSIYTNDKLIRTIKDLEEKIIDDTVLTGINTIIS